MKRILRILMIAICYMVSCNMVANAGNNKPISVNALPAKVQTLLSQHFNGQKVILATIESSVVSRSYDVVLQNGTKLEFDKKGKSYRGRLQAGHRASPADSASHQELPER